MIPTDGETEAAIHAAGRAAYDRYTAQQFAKDGIALPPWEDLEVMTRNSYLDLVLPFVWPALQALPDRLAEVRMVIEAHDSDATSDSFMAVETIRRIVRQP